MAEGDPKLGQNDSWRGDPISLSTPEDEVPTLYHTDTSYYSQVVRLVLAEEGVEYRSRGTDIHANPEQVSPWYIRINPNCNVPTLIYKGKPVVESKDISILIIDQISNDHKLLPSSADREKVLELVELHYEACNIEQVTMGSMMANNKIVGMMMPKKQRNNIAALEKVKREHPDMAEFVDARIPVLQERLKNWADPAAQRDQALGPLNSALDNLEKKLEESGGPFLCGGEYTLADCLFTCVLARLGMISMLGETFKSRPKLGEWWARIETRPSFKAAGILKEPIGISTMAKKMCTIL